MDDENASRNDPVRDMRRHIVGACIQWARIRGYSDSAGLLRGLILLAREPVSLDEMVQETGYSKSTISLTMNLLEELGLVRRIVIPGDKRHQYLPITDPEQIRTNMLDAIDREMQLFISALDRTENDILAGGIEATHLLERIASLKQSYEACKRAIDILRANP